MRLYSNIGPIDAETRIGMAPSMDYPETLAMELPSHAASRRGPLILDLFAGCGGLALGFEAAGFRTIGFEMLEDACETYRTNLKADCHQSLLTPDSELPTGAEVIIGGPPCQPFSVGGHQEGHRDSRNGFPAFLSAVKSYRPRVVIIENVRGMLYQNRAYLDAIADELGSLSYTVDWKLLNAANYGVPQSRERLFIVGHDGSFEFPEATHRKRPVTAGQALGELATQTPPGSKFLTPSMDAYVERYEIASKCVRPRDLHLDRPSRTVTCRNLNGATGDMLRVRLADGRRRRLTVREGARLQSFPDWFTFCGSEGSQYNQVGNAVPPLLAKAMAVAVLACLRSTGVAKVGRKRQGTLFH